jgi:hypothetical protein
MKLAAAALSCLGTLFAVSSVYATELDFTPTLPSGSSSANPNGQSSWSYEVDDVLVVVTAGPRRSNRLYWDQDDGFGVNEPWMWRSPNGYEYDEIDSGETLTVSFYDASNPGTAVNVVVDSFDVTDLFNETRGHNYDEIGNYELDSGGQVQFTAGTVENHSNVNGTGTVLVGATTTTLTLTAPGHVNGEDHEFSVAGLEFHVAAESVPELAASGTAGAFLLLSGFGLVLGGRRRRLLPVVA